jgi:hypothetical protein
MTNEYNERTKQISRRYFIAQITNLVVGTTVLGLSGTYNFSRVNRLYEQDKTLETKLERLEELHGLDEDARFVFIRNQTEYLDFSEEEISQSRLDRDSARTSWKEIDSEIDQINQDPSVSEYQSIKFYGHIKTLMIGLLAGLNSIRLFRNKSRDLDNLYQDYFLGYSEGRNTMKREQEEARSQALESERKYKESQEGEK